MKAIGKLSAMQTEGCFMEEAFSSAVDILFGRDAAVRLLSGFARKFTRFLSLRK